MTRVLSELKIEVTQTCPLACVHCSTNSHRNQSNSLSRDLVLRLLHEGAALGVEKVVLTGGEPLLWPHLPEAIATATELGINTVLYTSGIVNNNLTPLSPEAAASLAAFGLKRFIFSVYSANPEVHDRVTRYGTHRATLEALRNAVHTAVPVEIHFVAMRSNFRDLTGVMRLASDCGSRKVSVLRFVPQGRGVRIGASEDLRPDELAELADCITRLREAYPDILIRAGSPFNILLIGHTACNAAQDVLVVNNRGDIFPCDAFKNVQFPDSQFGSVLGKSLEEIWTESKYLNYVRTVLSQHAGETCRTCAEFSGCKSGCLAQKVVREGWGSVVSPDPKCLLQIQPMLSGATSLQDSSSLAHASRSRVAEG